MSKQHPSLTRWAALALALAAIAGLYLSSRVSYLLFHTIVETFTLTVAIGVFVIAYYTRHMHRNGGLTILGAAHLAAAILTVPHLLTYRGMDVIPGITTNVPTQLWIAMRYLMVLSTATAMLMLGRPASGRPVLGAYVGISALLLVAIFSGRFPDAYIDGVGLTPFKVASEYIVSALWLLNVLLLHRKRDLLDRQVYLGLLGGMLFAAAAGMAFTLYVDVYGLLNMVGHLLVLGANYLTYVAIIDVGLRRPYDLLFRDLSQREQALARSEGLLRSVTTNAPVALLAVDSEGAVTLLRGQGLATLGLPDGEVVGSPAEAVFARQPELVEAISSARLGEERSLELELGRDGEGHVAEVRLKPARDAWGRLDGAIGVLTDITERRRAELAERRQLLARRVQEAEEAERRRLARELHDDVGGNLFALNISLSTLKRRLENSSPDDLAAREALAERIDDAISVLMGTIQSVRGVMSALRPTLLDDHGLFATLEWYLGQYAERNEIETHLSGGRLSPRLPVDVELTLFRIAQEALSNIAKHANAGHAWVALTEQNGVVTLTIADDGVGLPDPAGAVELGANWGLLNMEERAQMVGGELTIAPNPGGGTQVIVTLPRDVLGQQVDEAEPLAERA